MSAGQAVTRGSEGGVARELSLRAQLQLHAAEATATRTQDRMCVRASRLAQRAARADFRRAVAILAEAVGER